MVFDDDTKNVHIYSFALMSWVPPHGHVNAAVVKHLDDGSEAMISNTATTPNKHSHLQQLHQRRQQQQQPTTTTTATTINVSTEIINTRVCSVADDIVCDTHLMRDVQILTHFC